MTSRRITEKPTGPWLSGQTADGRTVLIAHDPYASEGRGKPRNILVDGQEAVVTGDVTRARDGGTTNIPTSHGVIHRPSSFKNLPSTLDGVPLNTVAPTIQTQDTLSR